MITKDELLALSSGKVISMRPERTTGQYVDIFGKASLINGHDLSIDSNINETESVQYLTISVER